MKRRGIMLSWSRSVIGHLAVMAVIPGFGGAAAQEQQCQPPTAKTVAATLVYMAEQRNASAADVTLTFSEKANDSCYWELRFTQRGATTEDHVYITPDRKYVVPNLIALPHDAVSSEDFSASGVSNALTVGHPPSLGQPDAGVIIVEFVDFECPDCGTAEAILLATVKERSGVQLVARNLPLTMHPWALPAAEMSECVYQQSDTGYWDLRGFLLRNQSHLNASNLRSRITEFIQSSIPGVSVSSFDSCLDRGDGAALVIADERLAHDNDVRATPTFFVNGRKYVGVPDRGELERMIGAAMHDPMNTASGRTQR